MGIQSISNSTVIDPTLLAQSQKSSAKNSPVKHTEAKEVAQKAGGPPPIGGGSSARPPVASSASGSPRIYDKRDLNKDGVVSSDEKMKYALRHPSTPTATSQLKQGLSAYQQSEGKNEAVETTPRDKINKV